MRIGDEAYGLQFFFESFWNWTLETGIGQELASGEKEYVVRYNLIGKPASRPPRSGAGITAPAGWRIPTVSSCRR
ncbi:MAG: hypothetical protein HY360_13125 [Verrucomicrobia bacterium]|nr:hypothetical protein [Verrucomicrobiota bacterium]